ncbi:hypothetical protein Scep_007379 [Stephania cephalantha]|uniref:Uncharacterized protein n=1 Tax=Stephania cephalantha TaxID=152367 RepID=A0AAP0KCF6_9MAGN
MSSPSRAITALLVGDWRASLGDLVLFEEIWKWGFGFGGFWRWCSEFELLSAELVPSSSPSHKPSPSSAMSIASSVLAVVVCFSSLSSSSALSVAVVSSLHCSHCFKVWDAKPHAADRSPLTTTWCKQLDGTVNEWGWCKQKLGANAILAISLTVCKARASVKKVPFTRFRGYGEPIGLSLVLKTKQSGIETD